MRLKTAFELPEPLRSRAIEELGKQVAGAAPIPGSPSASTAQASKYRNQKIWVDGEKFDSKLEHAGWCAQLERKCAGELLLLLRQVSFTLAPNVRYRCDYFTVLTAGGFEVIDAKGMPTKEFEIKAKLMKSELGIEVLIWTRSGTVPVFTWLAERRARQRKKPKSSPPTPGATAAGA